MRLGTSGLLVLLAGGCPANDEMPPALQAVLDIEPYAEYAQADVPLPPTSTQMEAMPRQLFIARADAIKKVLYHGMARTRANRWRETDSNLAAMAREAESLADAPPEFVALLKIRATGNLPRTRAYTLRKAQEHLLQMYAVDELQMRLLLDCADADEKTADELLQHLPLHAVFNMVPQTPPTRAQITADLQLYADILHSAAGLLEKVQDEESARAVLPELKRLLLLHDTTLVTRAQLLQGLIRPDSEEMKTAAAALTKAEKELRTQRVRLTENNWFGSKELRALDYLLN